MGTQLGQQGKRELTGMRVVMGFIDHHDPAIGRQLGDLIGRVGGLPIGRRGQWHWRLHPVVEREVDEGLVVQAQFVL